MKAFKKTIDVITTVTLILIIVFAFLLVGVRLFGLEPYTVLSGSMEPEYHVGSLIYVKKASVNELNINDPVTYTVGNGTVVTHRIIDIIVDEDDPTNVQYKTKGDANDTEDGDPVPFSKVIGKPVFDVPLLGYVAVFVRTPHGVLIMGALIVILLILTFVPEIIRRIAEMDKCEAGASDLDAERREAERLLRELKALQEKQNSGEGGNDTSDSPENK